MNNLPVVAVLFLLGIIANCLSELLAYSATLTRQVLVFFNLHLPDSVAGRAHRV